MDPVVVHVTRTEEGQLVVVIIENSTKEWVIPLTHSVQGTTQAEETPASQSSSGRKRIDPEELNLAIKKYLEKHPEAAIRDVARAVGVSPAKVCEMEAWRRAHALREATKPSPKKTPRQLTDEMLAFRGQKNDPAAKVMQKEVIWRWIVEKVTGEQRAALFLKSPEEQAKLIELAREQYKQEHPDAT